MGNIYSLEVVGRETPFAYLILSKTEANPAPQDPSRSHLLCRMGSWMSGWMLGLLKWWWSVWVGGLLTECLNEWVDVMMSEWVDVWTSRWIFLYVRLSILGVVHESIFLRKRKTVMLS